MIFLIYGLIFVVILFVFGLMGLVICCNLLFMLISLEIMINVVVLVFVVVGSYWGQVDGQIMYIFVISFVVVEVSIGLVLLLQFYCCCQNLNIDLVSELCG